MFWDRLPVLRSQRRGRAILCCESFEQASPQLANARRHNTQRIAAFSGSFRARSGRRATRGDRAWLEEASLSENDGKFPIRNCGSLEFSRPSVSLDPMELQQRRRTPPSSTPASLVFHSPDRTPRARRFREIFASESRHNPAGHASPETRTGHWSTILSSNNQTAPAVSDRDT